MSAIFLSPPSPPEGEKESIPTDLISTIKGGGDGHQSASKTERGKRKRGQTTTRRTTTEDVDKLTSPPIAIRWDSQNQTDDGPSSQVAKCIFPVAADSGEAHITKLVRDCQPASFGYKGEDVLDESYRKAVRQDGPLRFFL